MSGFERKFYIKSFKSRIQGKVNSVVQDIENVIALLETCRSKVQERTGELSTLDSETFFVKYKEFNRDLEHFSEALFCTHASLAKALDRKLLKSIDTSESSEGLEDIDASPKEVKIPRSESPQGAVSHHLKQDVSNLDDDPSLKLSQNELHSSSCSAILNTSRPSRNDITLNETHRETTPVAQPMETKLTQACLETSQHTPSFKKSWTNWKNCSDHSLSQDSHYYSLSAYSNEQLSSITVTDSTEYCSFEADYSDRRKPVKVVPPSKVKGTHVKTILSEIPPPYIEIPSDVSAVVTYVTDPGDFWLRINLPGYSVPIFPISEYITENPPASLYIGDFCLAPFMEGANYYRAKVLDVLSEHIHVQFVDDGSTQNVPLCEVRPLPIAEYSTPMLAINCFLHGVIPVTDEWLPDATEKFEELKDDVKTCIMSCENNKYGVVLMARRDLYGVVEIDIGELLHLQGFAHMEKPNDVPDNIENARSDQNTSIHSAVQCSPHHASYDDKLITESELNNHQNGNSYDSGVSVTSYHLQHPNQSSESNNATNIGSDQLCRENQMPSTENYKTPSDRVVRSCEDMIMFDSFEDVVLRANDVIEKLEAENVYQMQEYKRDKIIDRVMRWDVVIPGPDLVCVKKNMMLVMLSEIVHPNEFYVNLAMQNSINLDELQEQMNIVYGSIVISGTRRPLPRNIFEGLYCAACFHQDENWYRAKILEIRPQHKVFIHYVDYGNKEVVNINELQPLTMEFASYPAFAIRCSLAGVAPLQNELENGVEHLNVWDENAITTFKELTGYEKCLTAQIESTVHDTNEPLQVLLWDTEGCNDLLINEYLANIGIACFDLKIKSKFSKASEIAALNSWDPMAEDYEKIENSYGVNPDDLETTLHGYKPQDEDYVCKYYSLRGYCPRGENCEYEHVTLVEGNVTRDQQDVYCFDSHPPLPETGSYVLIDISAIINPGRFYAILPFGNLTVDQIEIKIRKGASLKDVINSEINCLVSAMSNHYSNAPFDENTTISLACGKIVAAKCPLSGQWYRARVINVLDVTERALVFFVDFGNMDWVTRRNIRQMQPEFLHTPFQAVECFMTDIEPKNCDNNSQWSDEAKNYFADIVEEKILLAHVVNRSGLVLTVKIKRTDKEHKYISQMLVEKGYAQHNKKKIVCREVPQCVYIPG